MPNVSKLPSRLVWLLLVASAAMYILHFVHLAADFPNFSPWMDWSKYTDEGWYGDAAIRHFQLGHWYVPGDFNPAAALPVWPLMEAMVFRFTGVSLVAARALTVCVFGGILVGCYFLVRRWSGGEAGGLAAAAGVLLLAASPFCFVFTRLAILEPLLTLLMVLALLVAGSVRTRPGDRAGWRVRAANEVLGNLWQIAALGALLPLMILTKTTGLFLMPSIAFLLLAAVGYNLRSFLRIGIPAAALGGGVWLAYFGLVVRPHYLLDYRYLFSANAYTGITPQTAGSVLLKTFEDGAWMGRALYVCAVACVGVAVIAMKRLREHPLIPALLLWALGYEAFLAYHNNLQPRYYLVIGVPLTLLVPVTLEQIVLPAIRSARWRRGAAMAAAMGLGAIAVGEGVQTVSYVRHPQYTLLHAADEVRDVITAHEKEDPTHNPLVLSISGSDLSLMTGLHSICDDFGTLELAERVKQYRPGWYVAWNQVDDDKMDALTSYYHMERVAAFPAMDDPDRNLLIVYRLDDALHRPLSGRQRKPTPKRLRTKMGQQPSTSQLQH
jgi:hypothetical protein